ncbi:HTH-type transcriptional regulator MetR [Nymphon striatum]|nr:HTH-type transcriptional regulator MetR [Nymphon striatum]
MHIEFRHLRTVRAIHEAGGLAKAADQLNITQSALSHQIKGLEDQAGVELFIRRAKPMKLTAAGRKLLRLAERILPEREEVDLVVSSDPEDLAGVDFTPLFDYEPVFVASSQNPLAQKDFIEPEDLRDQHLITYPVDRTRLDVFTELLAPAGVEPKSVRQVELTAVILLLVASNRGVAVLPDWVVREVRYNSDYVTRPLTKEGRTKRLYAATRTEDTSKPFMANVIRLARTEPLKLQRAPEQA